MMWLIRNKKTGLPAGEVDQATKEAMESSGEYAGILSFEAITPKAKAPRPELVKSKGDNKETVIKNKGRTRKREKSE